MKSILGCFNRKNLPMLALASTLAAAPLSKAQDLIYLQGQGTLNFVSPGLTLQGLGLDTNTTFFFTTYMPATNFSCDSYPYVNATAGDYSFDAGKCQLSLSNTNSSPSGANLYLHGSKLQYLIDSIGESQVGYNDLDGFLSVDIQTPTLSGTNFSSIVSGVNSTTHANLEILDPGWPVNTYVFGNFSSIGAALIPNPQTGQITIAPFGTNAVAVSWLNPTNLSNAPGTLQSAASLNGPWQDVGTINPTVMPITGTNQFYRLRVPEITLP